MRTKLGYISCQFLPTGGPDIFCSFYLVKNNKRAENYTTIEAKVQK